MGREAFRVKIAEIASRRGGGWSPVAACTWRSRRVRDSRIVPPRALLTPCVCVSAVYLDGVLTLYSCYLSCARLADLSFFFFAPSGTGRNWTVDFFLFLFRFPRFLQKWHAWTTSLDTWLTWLVYGFNHSQGESFFRFFPLSLFKSERKLALERNWFRMFVSWGLNV